MTVRTSLRECVKIGYAKNVASRLHSLNQTRLSEDRFTLKFVLEGNKKDERALHKKFKIYNVEGEYFECAREIMEYGQLHHIHGVFDEHLEKHKERGYEHRKEYYQKNKERIIEHGKEYYQKNKERIIEHKKEYYRENKEHYREYRQKNKERQNEHYKKYYQKNKEQISERDKEYYQKNKEQISERKKEHYQKKKLEKLAQPRLFEVVEAAV